MTDGIVSPGPHFLRRLPDAFQLTLIGCLFLIPLGDLIAGLILNLHPGAEALTLIVALLMLGFYLAAS
uniref:hypothetical protein n=1 Tax=Halothiobacillus sp. TaxID=1891311 RepID=UPI002AD553A2